MWSYYGSKSKVVHLYPRPECDKIIEPFAGSARYALRYFDRDVLLVDKYEVIVRIWKWLQQCSPQDILGLPEYKPGEPISQQLTYEERWLVGFCCNRGSAQPKNVSGSFDDILEYWRGKKKEIAQSLFKIKHWQIEHTDYSNILNQKATWFIDPPYETGGEYYKESNRYLDYDNLSRWSRTREGQIIVCENTQATWLPFLPMKKIQGQTTNQTTEAIWTNRPTHYETQQLPLDMGVAA